LLLDVIEHIADDVLFLQNLKTRFKNLQKIIITIPVRSELFSNYDEFNEHYRRYDLNMIGKFLNETGIKITYCSYLLHTLYLLTRIMLRLFNKRKLFVSAPHGATIWIHFIIATYLYIDALFLPKRLIGTSLLTVLNV